MISIVLQDLLMRQGRTEKLKGGGETEWGGEANIEGNKLFLCNPFSKCHKGGEGVEDSRPHPLSTPL